MIDAMQRMIRPLKTGLANLVARAVVNLVDDSKKMQTLQLSVLTEETREGVERAQNYGFTSVPMSGAEAVVLFVGGRREHGLAVAVDDRRYRLTGLQPGEVALYHKDGASVVLKADGSIEVTPKPGATVKLAGETDAVAKGGDLNSAISTLGTAIATAVKGIPGGGPAGAAIDTAVGIFDTSSAAALSTKVKLS